MAPEPKQWDRFAIKAEIERRGLTLTGIANGAGLYEGACRQGLIGNSRRGAEAIALALDIPFRTLFPTLYRRGRHNEAKPSRTPANRTSVKTLTEMDSERRTA